VIRLASALDPLIGAFPRLSNYSWQVVRDCIRNLSSSLEEADSCPFESMLTLENKAQRPFRSSSSLSLSVYGSQSALLLSSAAADRSVDRCSASTASACAPSENVGSREISLATRRKAFVFENITPAYRTLVLMVGEGKITPTWSVALRWDARVRANDRVIRCLVGIGSSRDDIHPLPSARIQRFKSSWSPKSVSSSDERLRLSKDGYGRE
jgi:hypothetical protein